MGRSSRKRRTMKTGEMQGENGIRREKQSIGTGEKSLIGSGQMSTHSISNGLPLEIVTEILSFLRPEPLLRFRSACKSWRDIIDSHDFIHRRHLPRSRAASPTHLLFLKKNDVFYFDYESPASALTQIRLPFPIVDRVVSLASTRDGLLCLSLRNMMTGVYFFRVVNPIIGKVVHLPQTRCVTDINTCQLLWCPDPERVGGGGGVYKVLLVYKDKPGLVISLVCTLCQMEMEWRSIPNPFTTWEANYWESMESPSVNGAVHCVYGDLDDLGCRIVAFDILHEQYREILFPPGCCSPEKKCWYYRDMFISAAGSHIPRVVELTGLLSLFHMNSDGTLVETWLLTDYYGGVWTKNHTIDLTLLYRELHLDMGNSSLRYGGFKVYPVVKISDEELVMKVYAEEPSSSPLFFSTYFFSYDPVLNRTTILRRIKKIEGAYAESLVFPCETSNRVTMKKANKKKKKKKKMRY